MSLHLIESRQVRSATARKPGGAISSMFIHAALVTSVFTIASATPVRHVAKDPLVKTFFVTPVVPPPSVNRAGSNSSNHSSSDSRPSESLRPRTDLESFHINIPTEIPAIDASHAAIEDHLTFGRPHGVLNTGDGLRSGGAADILNAPQVDKPVVALAGFRLPRYPESMRQAGVQATVVATFVVDTLGRIESGSVSIPAESHAAFATAVRDALASARFRPAEANGHLVRQRVSQPFVFSLDRE